MKGICTGIALLLAVAPPIAATAASLRGIVHDPQHRPLPGAEIELRGHGFGVTRNAKSNVNGAFEIEGVAEGSYDIAVSASGFQPLTREVNVDGSAPAVLHLQLEVAPVSTSLEISGAASKLNTEASTVETVVTAPEITHTPGADLTNSLSMITDFTPGAYMVHDMLHMRGGHQVNWFFDGIPVVNTNIAANVAPLINPKNVQEMEVERGGYSSEYGDRTYGFFNVVTASGFEMNNQGDLILAGGNFHTADSQIDFGGHTARFAYYSSVDGNRSDLGLAPPVSQLIHDQESGLGGFVSLLYNSGSKDQFRWIASFRENHYQIPNTADAQTAGIRDLDLEGDYLGGFHWTHSFAEDVSFTVAPYYHFNSAHYLGGQGDTPFILDDNARSNYFGARADFHVRKKRHNAHAGIEAWGQRDNVFFGLTANPGGGVLNQSETRLASSTALFLEDRYQATSWLTLDLGLRVTHYAGLADENAADPRVGAAIRVPALNWTLHGYYAYYYQPPPLDSLAGPALDFAASQGFGFIPLRGERDIQRDIGLSIPINGWSLDVDMFHTSARNFLDHDVIGDSGIFIPLSDLGAMISGTEVGIRSPLLFRVARWRIAYSNQIAQGIGPITGGLLEFAPTGNFLLDHDQRNRVSSVLALTLPRNAWATAAYQFGSGFLNGNGPAHLPPHSTFDLALGKDFGRTIAVSVNAVNIANARYLLDTSNTFGGTHYINPRQLYAEMRYRF